ncbi:MAG: family 20 glycosylhydrolase [Ignavibacteriales bacterium]|nr:family 20 glycosylhydrolase [Ignavibacteriales bacterium]
MKMYGILFLCIISGALMAQQKNTGPVFMPLPKSVQLSNADFRLDNNFTIAIQAKENKRLDAAAARFLRRLSNRTGLFFAQHYPSVDSTVEKATMVIKYNKKGKLTVGENESYKLVVDAKSITLSAQNDLGILHGFETLLQMVAADANGFYFKGAVIEDEPRFSWRGLMFDISRHYMPMEMVKRNIDGMAAVKLNVLHWHLSDDQGFRVECKSLPELHKKGSDGCYYTQSQVKEVIKYANERGIRVVPEFDIPGHSTSWLTAYPELGSADVTYKIERRWGVFDPVFDPTNEKVYQFFDTFFVEMCKLFNDEYMHIGGDENNGKHWNASEKITKFKKDSSIADNHALQTYFNKRIQKILEKNNKKMMGWDEILHPDLPKDIVVHSWRGMKYLADAVSKGYMNVLSNGYYIDLSQHTDEHYLVDPAPDSLNLGVEERKRVLGGEATMWAELVTPENVDSRIWPRTAAIAERYWSQANVRDVDDMYRRLAVISPLLEEHGLTHIKNQDLMFRRIANYQEAAAVKILADVLEPVKQYSRHRFVKYYTSASPYTRMVDAVYPDAFAGRNFNKAVERLLAGNKAEAQNIKQQLVLWKENDKAVKALAANAPLLKEVLPVSKNLSELSQIALDAMKFTSGSKAPKGWKDDSLKKIKDAEAPSAEMLLRVIEGIEKLVEAVK